MGDSTKILDKVASSEATLKSAGVEATWIEINCFLFPAVVMTIIVIIIVVVTSLSLGHLFPAVNCKAEHFLSDEARKDVVADITVFH